MFYAASAWTQLMQAGLGFFETGLKAGEMMMAANTVMGRRFALMAAAAHDPARADYAELGRMAPEKVTAFSKAGAAWFNQWAEMQRETADYFTHLGSTMLAGMPPSPGHVIDLAERSSNHAVRTIARGLDAGGLALAPIHARATANARRLTRGKRRRRTTK